MPERSIVRAIISPSFDLLTRTAADTFRWDQVKNTWR